MFAQSNPQIHCIDKCACMILAAYDIMEYNSTSITIVYIYTLVSRYNDYSICFTIRQSYTFFHTFVHQHLPRNSGHVSQMNCPQFSSEQGSKERPRFPDIKDATLRSICDYA